MKEEAQEQFEGVVVDWSGVTLGEFRQIIKNQGDIGEQVKLLSKVIRAWPEAWVAQYGEPNDPASFDNLPLTLYEALSLYVVEVKTKQSARFQAGR